MTTGRTGYSLPMTFLNGHVDPQVYPIMTVSYPDDNINPRRETPLRVRFDASDSMNEFGTTANLTYFWEFGDGGTASASTVEHTYTTAYPSGTTARLRVTNQATGLTDTADATVFVLPPFIDTDGDGVQDPER